MNKKVTIHVLPVGMDERKTAILRTAFRMHQSERYEVAGGESAPDLAIVDIDGPTGTKVLEDFLAQMPDTPLILASVEPTNFDFPFLLKPLRVETLFPMLKSVREKIKSEKAKISMGILQATPRHVVPPASATAATIKTAKEELGSVRTTQPIPIQNKAAIDKVLPKKQEVVQKQKEKPVVPSAPVRPALDLSKIVRFDPSVGLLGILKSAQLGHEDVVILYHEEPLCIVLAAQGTVLLLKPLGSLQALCLLPEGKSVFFEQKIIPAGREIPTQLPSIKLMSFLWQLAIWTANGRLVKTIRTDRPLILKSWPNFTRVAVIPDAMRITAFLTRSPVNLSILYKLLNLDLHSLLNFLAAVSATDFLVMEQPTSRTMVSPSTDNIETQSASVAVLGKAREEVASEGMIEEPKLRPRSFLQKFLNKISTK